MTLDKDSIGYMAPEVVRDGKYNCESDVWSIGCMSYQMICGQLPFYSEVDEKETIREILEKPLYFN